MSPVGMKTIIFLALIVSTLEGLDATSAVLSRPRRAPEPTCSTCPVQNWQPSAPVAHQPTKCGQTPPSTGTVITKWICRPEQEPVVHLQKITRTSCVTASCRQNSFSSLSHRRQSISHHITSTMTYSPSVRSQKVIVSQSSRCGQNQPRGTVIRWICSPEGERVQRLPVVPEYELRPSAPGTMSPCQSTSISSSCQMNSQIIFQRPSYVYGSIAVTHGTMPVYSNSPSTSTIEMQTSEPVPVLDEFGFPQGELITLEIMTSVTTTYCQTQTISEDVLFNDCSIITFIRGLIKMFTVASSTADSNMIGVIFNRASDMRNTFYEMIVTQVEDASQRITLRGQEGRAEIAAIIQKGQETVQSKTTITTEVSTAFNSIQTTESDRVEEIVQKGLAAISVISFTVKAGMDSYFNYPMEQTMDASLAAKGLGICNSFLVTVQTAETTVVTIPQSIRECITKTTEEVKVIETKWTSCSTCNMRQDGGYWVYYQQY